MKRTFLILTFLIVSIIGILTLTSEAGFSEFENRNLAPLPKLTVKSALSGDFQKDFETAIDDNIPHKEIMKTLNSYVETGLGSRTVDDIYIGKNELIQKPLKNSRLVPIIKKRENYKNISVYLIPYKLYYAELPASLEKSQVGKNYKRSFDKWSEYSDIDFRKILTIDDYYKSDHHLNEKGVEKLLSAFGIDEYKTSESFGEFRGSESRKSGLIKKDKFIAVYDKNTIDFSFTTEIDGKIVAKKIVDFKRAEKTDKYLCYMGGNYPEVDIKGNRDISLLLLKDSFANPYISFFAERYGDIKVIDTRFFSGNFEELIEKYDKTIIITGI